MKCLYKGINLLRFLLSLVIKLGDEKFTIPFAVPT